MKTRGILVALLTTSLCIGGWGMAYGACTGGAPNGVLQSGEQCDDGNSSNSDNCLNDCTVARCGDGFGRTLGNCSVHPNETCTTAADCSPNVPAQTCVILGGSFETCENPGPGNPTCDPSTCIASTCGDGVVTYGETCDKPYAQGGALGCDATCHNQCGDGVLNPAIEFCDGTQLGGQTCTGLGFTAGTLSCTACAYNTSACTKCGNGIVEAGETCDKPYSQGGALGCDNTCHNQCGDGILNPSIEFCDGTQLGGATCAGHNPATPDGTPTCTAGCALDFSACGSCGDGTINAPQETCDPPYAAVCNGGPNDGDACTTDADCIVIDPNNPSAPQGSCGKNFGCGPDCTTRTCGDGVPNPGGGEQCDLGTKHCVSFGPSNGKECGTVAGKAACDHDGGTCPGPGNDDYTPDNCRTSCMNAFCGDGVADSTELCDDGFASGNDIPSGRGAIDDADNCPNGYSTFVTPIGGPLVAACHVYNVCGDGAPHIVDSSARCHLGPIAAGCAGANTCTQPLTGCDGGTGSEYICSPAGGGTLVTVPAPAKRCRLHIGQPCTVDANCGPGDTCGTSDSLADHCRSTCQGPSCGDDVKDSTEGCDEGKAICVSSGAHNGLECGTVAGLAACATDASPACLHRGTGANCNVNATDAVPGACNTDLTNTTCRSNCAGVQCGDGIIEAGETCDDGAHNGDGTTNCTATCQTNTCGDGYKGPTEACDNGTNNNDNSDCKSDCTLNVCGDGKLDTNGPSNIELCDSTPMCSADCCPDLTNLSIVTDAARFAASECSLNSYESSMQTLIPTQLQPRLQKLVNKARTAEGVAKTTSTKLCSQLKKASKAMTSSQKKLDAMALHGQIPVASQLSLKTLSQQPQGWYGRIRTAHGCK